MNYSASKAVYVTFIVACAALFTFPHRLLAESTSIPTPTSQAVSPSPEEASPTPLLNVEATDASSSAEQIPHEVLDYELPYPGILPDHPLYSLKLFRDRLLDFLIRDGNKRIEYNLLMADKRLNMGVSLVEKQQYDLAEETVSKGEKYLVKAVDGLYKSRDEGRDMASDLSKKLLLSIQKHRVVVDELKRKSPENTHSGYDSTLSTISESHGRIVDLGR